jgi:hypothetical protein
LKAAIPKITEKIKDHVLKEMKDWLAEYSPMHLILVSNKIQSHTANMVYQTLCKNKNKLKLKVVLIPLLQTKSLLPRSVVLCLLVFLFLLDEIEDTRLKIDFRPLYQCLLIHEFLEEKEKLSNEYDEIRKVLFQDIN